ncbi:MAG: CHRD domain-containing protein [Fimbriimonas sp.]
MSLFALALVGCAGSGGSTDNSNTQRITAAGGSFSFQNGSLRLDVPTDSINSPADVTVAPTTSFPADSRVIAGTAFHVSAPLPVTFDADDPAIIRIKYPELIGADPESYAIYRVEGDLWARMSSQNVTTSQRYVEAEIDGIGTFAILAGVPGTTFRTVLGPGQETTAVVGSDINASGRASVTIPITPTELLVGLDTEGLTNVTAAHIHVGALGEPGPVRATLFGGSDVWSDDYQVTVDNARLSGITMAELIQAIHDGNAYINVHTATNPGGAIRGQLGDSVTMSALLNGHSEVPMNESAATGEGTLAFNRDMSSFTVMIDTSNLTNVTAAHIHHGIPGEPGPVVFPLFAGGSWPSHFMMTITETNFTPVEGIPTYRDAVNAILSGDMYFNVHTNAFPNGEIRGQIVAHMP